MEFTAKQIAEILNGKVEGNHDVVVKKLAKIEEGEVGAISFLANPKYTHFIYQTKASIVIVNKDFKAEKEIKATLIRVDDAYMAFAKLLEAYKQIKLN
ncbi:MAG: UDP-3-O-(3-hydroxymyristoyl)glucosamine N-acyltransferase, partial [Bacteroidetes bacterium HGW-Bacteroidetes-17]